MSGTLKIRFAPDMPAAAVEVVAPDLASVERVWLKSNQQASVDVPSEGSFLRVYLASGQIITLEDPGNLNRLISLSDLMSRVSRPRPRDPSTRRRRSVGEIKRAASLESYSETLPMQPMPVALLPTLEGGVQVRLLGSHQQSIAGSVRDENTSIVFAPNAMEAGAYDLVLDAPELQIRVRVPGTFAELMVRSDESEGGRRVVSVRLRTKNEAADTISAYMNRGDIHSAATLAASAEKAEELLSEKVEDPYGAAIGAYLLLRLRRHDLMHDWTDKLANWYPNITDGAVIRAWHLIQAGGRDEVQIKDFFKRALAGSLPIFSEGLQLLSDGLRLMGELGQGLSTSLNARVGVPLSDSPFTATMHGARGGSSAEIDVDIDYGSQI